MVNLKLCLLVPQLFLCCWCCRPPCHCLRSVSGQYYTEAELKEKLHLSETRFKAVRKFCMREQLWKFDKYEVRRLQLGMLFLFASNSLNLSTRDVNSSFGTMGMPFVLGASLCLFCYYFIKCSHHITSSWT